MLRVEGVCACTRVCMCVHVFICLPCSSCCRVTTKPSRSKGLKLETQDIELPLSPPTPFSPTPLTTLWQMHNVPRQRTALGCRKHSVKCPRTLSCALGLSIGVLSMGDVLLTQLCRATKL